MLEEIFEKVQQDPSTQISSNWIDNILENITNKEDNYHYLINHTIESLDNIKRNVLSNFDDKEKWEKSLSMYRYIESLDDLRLGSHIRWIRKREDKSVLTNGGILIQIKFLDKGTYVVSKNGMRIMQYQLDNCDTFQKLSAEEWIILLAKNNK